jgi:8-oxo-dGTP diphosphatase
VAHVIHRKSESERVSFFFSTDDWDGEPEDREPEKCSELAWYPLRELPPNMVPHVRHAINQVALGNPYSEFGWRE